MRLARTDDRSERWFGDSGAELGGNTSRSGASAPEGDGRAEPCGTPEPPVAPPACRTHQTRAIDLDHDGTDERVRRRRCGPEDMTDGPDGGFICPQDTVVVSRGTSPPLPLYDNLQTLENEHFEVPTPIRFGPGDRRLFAMHRVHGAGHIQDWNVYDIADGALRRATGPSTDDAIQRLRLRSSGSSKRVHREHFSHARPYASQDPPRLPRQKKSAPLPPYGRPQFLRARVSSAQSARPALAPMTRRARHVSPPWWHEHCIAP